MAFSEVSTLWAFEVAKFLIINNTKVGCYNILIKIIYKGVIIFFAATFD